MKPYKIRNIHWGDIDRWYGNELHIIPMVEVGRFKFILTYDNLMLHRPLPDWYSDPAFAESLETAAYLHQKLRRKKEFENKLEYELDIEEDMHKGYGIDSVELVNRLNASNYPTEKAYQLYKEGCWILTDNDFFFKGTNDCLEGLRQYSFVNPGYVYLVSIPSGPRKIGRSVVVKERIKAFDTDYPEQPTLEHQIFCRDCVASEKALHQRYADKRIRRTEWFWLQPDQIEEIKQIQEL